MDDGTGRGVERRCGWGGGVLNFCGACCESASGASVGWPHHGERPVTTLMVAKLGVKRCCARARSLASLARAACFYAALREPFFFFYRGEDDGCFSLSLPLFSTFHPWHISQVMRLLSSIHQEVFLWSVGISLKSVVQSSQSLSFRSRVIFELSLFERALWSHLALAIPLEVYL